MSRGGSKSKSCLESRRRKRKKDKWKQVFEEENKQQREEEREKWRQKEQWYQIKCERREEEIEKLQKMVDELQDNLKRIEKRHKEEDKVEIIKTMETMETTKIMDQEFIGMITLKKELKKMTLDAKAQLWRQAQKGYKGSNFEPFHMILRGNPGTGKTTVAHFIAQILYETGYLTSNKVIEVQRTDLVGAYLGQTGIKTAQVIQKAGNGVLFIDEAYRLSEPSGGAKGRGGGTSDYGLEAIEELMRVMTHIWLPDHPKIRTPFMIFAGYPELMKHFEEMNIGLFRRIRYRFDFPDYTPKELVQIFIHIIHKHGFSLDHQIQNHPTQLEELFTLKTTPSLRSKVNATMCKDILLEAISFLNEREAKCGKIGGTELIQSDIEQAIIIYTNRITVLK